MHKLQNNNSTLVTGGSGYIGGLIIESLLRETQQSLVLLVRHNQDLKTIIEPVRIERISRGQELTNKDIERISILNYGAIESLDDIKSKLVKYHVTEIIHSAGCLEYFNIDALEKVNVEMTQRLVELAEAINVDRFIYISTSYSSGYTTTQIKEKLHETPSADPTDYTLTKRKAEWLVANSDINSLIIRPSILIGNSKSGRYSGKRYGLYQQWMGLERLMCDRYHAEIHLVASKQPVNVLHQDSFQNAFIGAYKNMVASSILHITSNTKTAPSMRNLWDMWLEKVARPHRVFYYSKLDDVPLKTIHNRQRAYLMFASVNLEIGAHFWDFSTKNLQNLRERGIGFVDATLDSVAICQDRFVTSSQRIQKFIANNKKNMCSTIEVLEVNNSLEEQVD